MTAREKFKIGDRVRMAAKARDLTNSRGGTGEVVGFGNRRRDVFIRVLEDGYVNKRSWHMSFWEKIDLSAAAQRELMRQKLFVIVGDFAAGRLSREEAIACLKEVMDDPTAMPDEKAA